MKISVCIPAYNEEKYISSCLEHITNQTRPPDEIIVADNNCTDKSIEIAKSFGARIVPEQKQGMIYARDTAFNAAKYEIIARTDCDTKAPNNWLAQIENNFQDSSIDLVTGPVTIYDLPGGTAIWSDILMSAYKLFNGGHVVPFGPNFAMRKSMWERIKNHVCQDDTLVHEDIDIGMNVVMAHGNTVYDKSMKMAISGRRIKGNPLSFFFEYPIRSWSSIHLPRKPIS